MEDENDLDDGLIPSDDDENDPNKDLQAANASSVREAILQKALDDNEIFVVGELKRLNDEGFINHHLAKKRMEFIDANTFAGGTTVSLNIELFFFSPHQNF